MNKYIHKIVENYVQKFWKKQKTFKSIENFNKEKYYCLSMFPYPSGNLHIGHIRNYTIGDILARFNRMIGKNVLYPIGWDAFGLPAENAAINKNISPDKWTFLNINYMRKQLKTLGFSFDWDREIITCNYNYYKWEQSFFRELYKKGIAYKKYSPVNWCNKDKTVLANEQVIDNCCWRCNSKVIIKYVYQWFLKITNYSNKLLNDINNLKDWPDKVKLMQKNWIGKSLWFKTKLILINFNNYILNLEFKNTHEFINIKYVIISLKNDFSKKIIKKFSKINNLNINEVYKHIFKNGYIKTNILAIHDVINKYLPIIIVNNDYMIFIYNLKYLENNNNINDLLDINLYKKYINLNKNNNSIIEVYNNISNIFSLQKIINNLNNIYYLNYFNILNFYKYKIQDWCISRQRSWGTPIPNIIFKKNEFKNDLNNTNIKSLEKDTFDTFIQSSWYHIRFTCSKYNKFIINKKIANYWLPIDQYIGGIEHATMHLLYFRFYHKLFKEFNLIDSDEPAIKLLCQGMVLSKTYYYIDKNNNKFWVSESEVIKKNINNKICFFDKNNNKLIYDGLKKMSKSKNNGINPKYIIDKYGSDTLRTFLIFSAPSQSDLIWKESNIIGIYKFLNKVWFIIHKHIYNKKNNVYLNYFKKDKNILIITFNTIRNITYDMEIKKSFNTSISNLMNLTNNIIKIITCKKYNYYFIQDIISVLLRMLYPFAPHISFFLWNKIGFSNIDYSDWPNIDKYKLISNNSYYIVYINNKFKTRIETHKNINEKKLLNLIYNNNIIKNCINNKKILKTIFIKNKLINILINEN